MHDLFVGWTEALQGLGVKVIPFNLDARLSLYDAAYFNISEGKFKKALSTEQAIELAVNGLNSTLYKTAPDVLLIISGFLIPPELLDNTRRYGTKVVVVHTEEPYEHARELELAQHADISLLNDPVNLDRFPTGSYYQPHCYRPELHRPGTPDPDLTAEFAFVGTGFESRIAFFEAMVTHGLADHDVLLGGNWQRLTEDSPLGKFLAHKPEECLDNASTALVYRSAKVGLNLYRREHEAGDNAAGWAIGPREVEMAACGLPFLRDSRGEGDELFPEHLRFTTPAEAVGGLRWWLDHPLPRAAAAQAARAAVADRTFHQAAVRLLNHIEK